MFFLWLCRYLTLFWRIEAWCASVSISIHLLSSTEHHTAVWEKERQSLQNQAMSHGNLEWKLMTLLERELSLFTFMIVPTALSPMAPLSVCRPLKSGLFGWMTSCSVSQLFFNLCLYMWLIECCILESVCLDLVNELIECSGKAERLFPV